MLKKYTSRKFVLAIIPLFTLCIVLATGRIDFNQFLIGLPIVLGLYYPANVMAKALDNDRKLLTGGKEEE